MSLSCGYCDDGGDWYYFGPEDYTRLDTKRSRKCCSCGSKISVGDLCAKFPREQRNQDDSVDYRIHGDEKSIATWWMCENCADHYFNLTELGYCVMLTWGEHMRELVRNHAEMTTRYERRKSHDHRRTAQCA